MLEITVDKDKQIHLHGRFIATEEEKALKVFKTIKSTCIVDFTDLEYISSAGLGVLVMTQNRLQKNGHKLILKNMNKHIRELFNYTGFELIFEIE